MNPFTKDSRNIADELRKAAKSGIDSGTPRDRKHAEEPSPPPLAPANLVITGNHITDPGSIPEHLQRVPGFCSDVMDFTLQTAPYPNTVLAFCGSLALQAALAGRKVRDFQNSRTNPYLLATGESGVGKDASRKTNQKILAAVERVHWIGGNIASGQGLEDALEFSPTMIYQTDEIDTMLREMKGDKTARHEAMLGTLLTMWSAGDTQYPKRVKAGIEHKTIDQPNLILFGTAIPKTLYGALSTAMLDNGLLARMVIVEAGPRSDRQSVKSSDPPQNIIDAARWWVELDAPEGDLSPPDPVHPDPNIVEHTSAAMDALNQFGRDCDRRYNDAYDNADTVSMALWARAVEKSQRLALVYACSANRGTEITPAAIEWSSQFVEHATRRMLFMAGLHVAENPFHADCLKLTRYLEQAPDRRMSHSELLKRSRMSSRDFTNVVRTMHEQGDIMIIKVPTAGRPAIYYRLNK